MMVLSCSVCGHWSWRGNSFGGSVFSVEILTRVEEGPHGLNPFPRPSLVGPQCASCLSLPIFRGHCAINTMASPSAPGAVTTLIVQVGN